MHPHTREEARQLALDSLGARSPVPEEGMSARRTCLACRLRVIAVVAEVALRGRVIGERQIAVRAERALAARLALDDPRVAAAIEKEQRLFAEFAGSNTKVYALTDFYEKGHEYLEAYLMAAYGWTLAQIGSHAGIQDTSQMMYVNPSGIRFDQLIHSEVDRQAASVSGDPTKSTAEFGRMGINFKANGAIAQYMQMKTPPRRNTQGG